MTKAIMIPWDAEEPIINVELRPEDEGDQMKGLIFGPVAKGAASRVVGGSVMTRGVQAFYDDEGMYNQPFNVNVRAMKLWAHVSGRKFTDFVQPLWGNYVVFGYDEEGAGTDVPASVTDFFSEDVIVGAEQ